MSNDTTIGPEHHIPEPDTEKEPAGDAAFDLNPAKYLGPLDDVDMTEAQKVELLETLWSIMRMFVELGFQMDICAQFLEHIENAGEGGPEDVQSKD